jgi:NADPH2:quinone reductase
MDRLPTTMRAIQIDAYGGAEVLVTRELATPAAGPGEVLVRLAYSGINFMDIYTRRGRYVKPAGQPGHYQTALPLTLGIEGAGRIVAMGAGVSGWQVGDRVAYALARGSYAEYAAVPVRQLARVPDDVGLDLAAALMFQGLTAHYLAHDVGALAPGRSCLVHSGAGGVGQLLIQLAKGLQATVVATASSADKRAIAHARGADAVCACEPGEFVDACRRASGGAGVDVVFDSIGAPVFDGNLRALRRSGLFVHYGANGGAIGPIDPMQLADSGSLFFTRPRLADHVADAETVARRAAALFDALAGQRLQVDIVERHGFDDVARAHRRLEERTALGKSVLVIDPTVR